MIGLMGWRARRSGRPRCAAAGDEGRAMHDYDVFSVESKASLAKSREFWNPGQNDCLPRPASISSSTAGEAYFIWNVRIR